MFPLCSVTTVQRTKIIFRGTNLQKFTTGPFLSLSLSLDSRPYLPKWISAALHRSCDLNAGETDSMDSGYEEIWWKKKKFLCPTKKIPRRLRSSQGDYLSSDVAQPHFFPPPFLVINPLARTHPFCGEFFRGIRTNSTPKFFPSWNLYLCGMKRLVLVGRRSKTRMRSTFTRINSSDKKKTRCCVRVEEKSSLMEMFIDML